MAIDKQKFLDDMIAIHEKQKQINAISAQRKTAEEAMVVEFRVNEANARRAEIEAQYRPQLNALRNEINQIQESLGEV